MCKLLHNPYLLSKCHPNAKSWNTDIIMFPFLTECLELLKVTYKLTFIGLNKSGKSRNLFDIQERKKTAKRKSGKGKISDDR